MVVLLVGNIPKIISMAVNLDEFICVIDIFCILLEITFNLVITDSNNCKNHREYENEDKVEEHENFQVDDDSDNHCYDVAQRIKYAQIEECLDQLLQHQYRHHQLVCEVVRV